MDTVLRQGKIEIAPLDPPEFLKLLRQHSFTDVVGSRICSQFEHELRGL